MTMKRVLGVVMLVLLACGSGVDTPTSGSGSPAKQESKAAGKDAQDLRDHFVWGDESKPARDWDADVAECEKRAENDPRVTEKSHPLVKVGVVMKCLEGMGWSSTH